MRKPFSQNEFPASSAKKVRTVTVIASLALLAGCNSPSETPAAALEQAVETCVAFSYGTLRATPAESTPGTAEAIRRLAPIAYHLQFGQTMPPEFLDRLEAAPSPLSSPPQTLHSMSERVDTMFNAQHPDLSPNGPVADDRGSFCYQWPGQTTAPVRVQLGSYVLPWRLRDSLGREPLQPQLVTAGTVAS